MKLFIFCCCVLVSIFGFSQTFWHVSVSGSDATGDGTLNNPYASLQKAEQEVQPGDTVYVHEGTFRNSDFNDGDIWGGDNLLSITANGTESDPITFSPFPGDIVILEFDSTYGVIIRNSSYINFTGFEVKGISDQITQTEADSAWGLYKDDLGVVHDLAVELGIDINDPALAGTEVPKPSTPSIDKPSYYNGRGIVANSSHHITISNNIVRDVPSSAIRCQQSDYTTIAGNTVYNNTFWTTQGVGAITVAEATPTPPGDTSNAVKIILEKNYVHHNENRLISWNPTKTFVKMVIDEGTGLFLTRNRDTYTNGYILIANNISAFSGASGIVSHFTNRVIIEHNTVFKNGTTNDSAAGGIGINNVDDVIIRNNISYAEPDHWALGTLALPNTNVSIYNNLLYNENGSETIYNNLSTGWAEANPLFTDAINSDYTLIESSPAINSGSSLGTQTDDIEGNLRDDGTPDIGAYEYSDPLSINDLERINLKVYPNPVSENLYIKSKNQNINNITINDILGKQVLSKKNINNTSTTICLREFEKGLYFVKISTDSNSKIFIIIKK
jgi:parallel beta-helix repeat protein